MALSPEEIKQILHALSDSDWDEAVVTVDGVSIAVSRTGPLSASWPTAPNTAAPAVAASPVAAPAPAAAVPAPAPPPVVTAPPAEDLHVITAPSVGVFWRSPRPGLPPFVEVGSEIKPGDTVCIVEMMKLMNNVVSDVAGTVVAVHAENSAQVEYGTPLISISPVAGR